MFRFSRAYQQTAEFEAKQMAFDFAAVARVVMQIAVDARKAATAFLKDFSRRCWSGWTTSNEKHPQQLVLESDDFHQIPLLA
ncbi:MAG TPA: hypothetical protein VFF03_13535 [Rhodocyclaceae bacterium]|nr:hypothetical protein [Rhodocyclaceae bacterium]